MRKQLARFAMGAGIFAATAVPFTIRFMRRRRRNSAMSSPDPYRDAMTDGVVTAQEVGEIQRAQAQPH